MSRPPHGPNDFEPDEPTKETITCVDCGEEFWYLPEDMGDLGLEVEVYEDGRKIDGFYIVCEYCLKDLEPELVTAGVEVRDGRIVRA